MAWFQLGAAAILLAATLAVMLESPHRSYRVAALSGALVQLELLVARALVYSPERWSIIGNPPTIRASIAFAGAWLLILNTAVYARWRRGADTRLRGWLGWTVLVWGLVLGAFLGVGYLRGLWDETLFGLPYDAALALLALVGPPLSYELLWRSDLWPSLDP